MKSTIINVTINGNNTYTATYSTGTVRTASLDKMPATVKAWLAEKEAGLNRLAERRRQEEEKARMAEKEKVSREYGEVKYSPTEIVLEPLPERGTIISPPPEERTFSEDELDAFQEAFSAEMEAAEAAETAQVEESSADAGAMQSEAPACDVEGTTAEETESGDVPGLLPRVIGAAVAGSLLLAVEAVYVAATAPLMAAAQVARWIAAALLALAGALDQARTHAPQIRDAALDAVAMWMDTVLDAGAWIAYQAAEIGTEAAWIAAGLVCTAAIKVKAAWDFRREVVAEGKEALA